MAHTNADMPAPRRLPVRLIVGGALTAIYWICVVGFWNVPGQSISQKGLDRIFIDGIVFQVPFVVLVPWLTLSTINKKTSLQSVAWALFILITFLIVAMVNLRAWTGYTSYL